MAENIEILDPEITEIIEHISNDKNFLLSGGAGSGKTYVLVKIIKYLLKKNPTQTVACMTYTNAAVKEIEERVNHPKLKISTIHDFLWDVIKNFQDELKQILIQLICDEESGIQPPLNVTIDDNFFSDKKIEYKEYVRIIDGFISHDEVLIVASKMFEKHLKICDILIDKYPYVFVDEYQDTNSKVIDILLKYLDKSSKKNIIGFFGDSMQSIYNEGVGDLSSYVGTFEEVIRKQNRRNPQSIINLANKLRTDSVIQEPSSDASATNMTNHEVKPGSIKFLYSSINNLVRIREYLGWNFEDTKECKELNLTHKLIAGKADIKTLYDVYDGDKIIKYRDLIKQRIKDENITTDFSDSSFGEVINSIGLSPSRGQMTNFINSNQDLFDFAKSQPWKTFSRTRLNKDQLLDDKKQNTDEESKKGSKRDKLIKHLFKIQNNIFFYTKDINTFIRKTELKITRLNHKIELSHRILELTDVHNKSIEEIIDLADEYGICKKDSNLENFMLKNPYIYERVKTIPFKEFQSLYKYLEGFTPFSTQHKVKGSEFDNVLVILDNGRWNQYNFEYLFTNNATNTSVLERTQKIFYVCCTRAKEELAVFYVNPSQETLNTARDWFGEDCVIDIDRI